MLVSKLLPLPHPSEPLRPRSVEVEIAESPGRPEHPARPGAVRRSRRRLPRNLSLKDLGVYAKGNLSQPRPGGASAAKSDGQEEDGSSYGFEDLTGNARASPVLSYVFRRIDGGIAFPQDLYSIAGEVTARLRFDEQGRWIDSVTDIREAGSVDLSRYFRVYLIHRLRALLADPIPADILRSEPHAFTVTARFVFERVAPESVEGARKGPPPPAPGDPSQFSEVDTDGGQSVIRQLGVGRQGMYGHRFFYYRAHLASPLDWKLGPLVGYGLSPSIGIDPDWFVRKIGNLIHHRDDVDPLQKYREDPDW